MTRNYTMTYLSCGQCTEKTHCEECGHRLEEIIKGYDAVEDAKVNVTAKIMSLNASDSLDEDDLIDWLEGIGVFAD